MKSVKREFTAIDLINMLKDIQHLGIYQFDNIIQASQSLQVYNCTMEYLNPGETVFDWGCGNGHFPFFLLYHGIKTVAFDLDTCPIKDILKTRWPNDFEFYQGVDPIKLPFEQGTFNAVFSLGVLDLDYAAIII